MFSGTRVYMAPKYFRFGWYDGCQATVWALGMILVDMLSPYMAFSKPEQAYSMPPRIPHHLSPGNIMNKYIYLLSLWNKILGPIITQYVVHGKFHL